MKIFLALILNLIFSLNSFASESEKETMYIFLKEVEKPYSQKVKKTIILYDEEGNYYMEDGHLIWIPPYNILFLKEGFEELMKQSCEIDLTTSLSVIRYTITYTFSKGVSIYKGTGSIADNQSDYLQPVILKVQVASNSGLCPEPVE
jgi:hypothetical protein